MASKLITFLGATNYQEGVYTFSTNAYRTRYVQVALANMLGPFDEINVFVTPGARQANWDPPGGLAEVLLSTGFNEQMLKTVDIKDGRNMEEVWDIFNKLHSSIENGDRLSFDITHSYRSLPVLTLACIQYVRALKEIELMGIYYGAWDAGEIKDGLKYAPIFDLTPFLHLLDWSAGVADFVKYGVVEPLSNIIAQSADQIAGRKVRKNLSTMVNDLNRFSGDVSTCRGEAIYEGQRLKAIRSKLKILEKKQDELLPGFVPLLEKMEGKVDQLDGWGPSYASDFVKRGFGAVDWCLENNLIQQAYTLLQENLITWICEISGLSYQDTEEDRILAAQAAALLYKDESEWKEPARSRKQIVYKIWEKAGKDLLSAFNQLTTYRNNINHGGINRTDTDQTVRRAIKNLYADIKTNLLTFEA